MSTAALRVRRAVRALAATLAVVFVLLVLEYAAQTLWAALCLVVVLVGVLVVVSRRAHG